MPYVATVNTPGYLPQDDDPPIFDTAREAWDYLADERKRHEDDATEYGEYDPYTGTVNVLERCAEGIEAAWQDAGLDIDGTGTVYGDTPGYDGSHDLGLAYSVTYTDEDPDA